MQTGEAGQRLLNQSISQIRQLELLTGSEGSSVSVSVGSSDSGKEADQDSGREEKHFDDKEQSPVFVSIRPRGYLPVVCAIRNIKMCLRRRQTHQNSRPSFHMQM